MVGLSGKARRRSEQETRPKTARPCSAFADTQGALTVSNATNHVGDRRLAYSVDETAAQLGCTRTHVHNLIKSGVLPSLKLGRRRLIRREALEALLEQLEGDAS